MDVKLLRAGITKQRQHMLQRLTQDDRLLAAYKTGFITRSGIGDALKLPDQSRAALIARLQAGDRVKGTEIRQMRRTHRTAAWSGVQAALEIKPAQVAQPTVDVESARRDFLTTCQDADGQAAWARKYGMLLLEAAR